MRIGKRGKGKAKTVRGREANRRRYVCRGIDGESGKLVGRGLRGGELGS